MKSFGFGYNVTREVISFAWHNKRLWWYQVVLMIFLPIFNVFIARSGFETSTRFFDLSMGMMATKILILFISSLIPVFISAALISRFYAIMGGRRMGLFKSFDFSFSLLGDLFMWAIILMIALLTKMFIKIDSGFSLKKVVDQGVSFNISYSQTLLWLLSWTIIMMGSLFIFYVLPILINKNKCLWPTIKESILLFLRNPWVTILSSVFLFMFFASIFLVILLFALFITWIISFVLSISFGIGWLVPFALVLAIPFILFLFYVGTAGTLLPAMLYLKLSKKR